MLIRLDRGDDVVYCGICFGPKMFSGGISKVTRQYDGKRRSSRICSVVNVLSERFMVWTPDLILRRSNAWQRGGAGVLAATLRD
jgi:hypothetical protein